MRVLCVGWGGVGGLHLTATGCEARGSIAAARAVVAGPAQNARRRCIVPTRCIEPPTGQAEE